MNEDENRPNHTLSGQFIASADAGIEKGDELEQPMQELLGDGQLALN
ncbi:hypothetical protein AVEN_242115-1, partial [Araneus ventricosus]